MKRRSLANPLVVVAILLVMAGARWGWGAYREYQEAQANVPEGYACVVDPNAKKYGGANVEVIGEASAPLKPLWVLPNHALADEVLQSIEEVKQWVRQHPKLVQLSVAVINTREAAPLMRAEGVKCAGLSVQGITRFRLWDRKAGRFQQVVFERAPSSATYLAPQIIDFFEQYLERIGHLPLNRTLGQSAARRALRGGAGLRRQPSSPNSGERVKQ